MSQVSERVSRLLDRTSRRRKVIISPEGVPLDIQIAETGERLGALALDLFFMFSVIIGLFILFGYLFFSGGGGEVSGTLFMFLVFLVHNFYFLHFELVWQGRTPGKRICRLRVINRHGGELTPGAVIARNLTREVEIFMPLVLMATVSFGGGWLNLALLGWVLGLAVLPMLNKDHLRAGDIIAGTQVIAMPKRVLLGDLTLGTPEERSEAGGGYAFTAEQLALYGVFELQVLEDFLRRPPKAETEQMLAAICRKICAKIGWREPVPSAEVRRFLTDFYAAERAELERGQLFGRTRADKIDAAAERKKRLAG